MMKRILRSCIIIFLILPLMFISCSDENKNQIPYEYVNFSINPSSIEYGNLQVPGNYAYVTGGYRGIIIYHVSQYEYRAFDRACTFDWEKSCSQTEVDEDEIFLVCPCCGSKYLMLDGTVFEGPAARPLREYACHFDGNYLYVNNQ